MIRLWTARLDAEPGGLRPLLSSDERLRADRFRFERHRAAYTVARATLRLILGDFLGRDPAVLRFVYGPHGKPRLEGGPHFNLSHAEGLALYAVSEDVEVGVDLEFVREPPDIGDPACVSPEDFWRRWTRREALLKAEGVGLSGEADESRWTLRDLEPAPGYVGALALRTSVAALSPLR